MASGKKSFVLYADLIHLVRKLPKETSGALFLHILEYVNDLNPVIENDLLLEISFEPIKQQLKRDLQDWEGKKLLRSESGKLGGIKSGESRRNKANKANKANASKPLSNEANEAVNVTVTVNDTVTDNVIEIQADEKKENIVGVISKKANSGVKKMIASHDISDPFGGKLIKWKDWKNYKRKEHRFSYKSSESENQALKSLFGLSGGDIGIAERIIEQSIGNGWQGLFELKNKSNGQSRNQTPSTVGKEIKLDRP